MEVLPKPKCISQFKPKLGDEDKYKYYVDYQNSPQYKDEAMQKVISSVDGLREYINNRKDIIFYNNDTWLKLNMLKKETGEKRFDIAINAFADSFRGRETHAYKLGFENLVKDLWEN